MTVMDTSALLAKMHLAQALAQQMKVGDAATVTVPGVADAVPAKVSLISPALDPGSTTVEVWLRVEQPEGTLKAGTPVHARLSAGRRSQALTDSGIRAADGAGRREVGDGGGRR